MKLVSHHQPEEFRKGQKETPCIWPPPRILLASIHLGWAMHVPPGRTLSDWLGKDNLETNPVKIKPKTSSHEAERFSWVLPGTFPINSFALSDHVSPSTTHFQVLDKSPLSGPGRGPLPAATPLYRDTAWNWTRKPTELSCSSCAPVL